MNEEQKDLLLYLAGEISFPEWQSRKQTRAQPTVESASSLLEQVASLEALVEETVITQPTGSHVPEPTQAVPVTTHTGKTQNTVQESVIQKPKPSTVSAQQIPIDPNASDSEEDIVLTSVEEGVAGLGITLKQEVIQDTEEEAGGDDSDDDVIIVDRDATVKYLTGEMSFEEYSALLERGSSVVKVEPLDTVEVEITTTPEVTVTSSEIVEQTAGPSTEKPKKTGKRKPRTSKLPRYLKGLMGEANVKFARGEHDEAIKMCMEVIRLAPNAWEPFQTLSIIYEEQGDIQKSLQYALIGAHLNPRDIEEWLRLASMSLDQDNLKQAISCYDKAVRCDPTNVGLLWERNALYERTGDRKRAMDGYQQILQLLPKENADKYLQLCRDMTRNFHNQGEMEKALTTMETAFEVHAKSVAAEDVNLLCELYIAQKVYNKPLHVLIQHCGVVFLYPDGTELKRSEEPLQTLVTENSPKPDRCTVPMEIPVDLRVKLSVCMIQLLHFADIMDVVEPVFDQPPDEVGDLYLDIAESYMCVGHNSEARPILETLVHSEKYNLAAVWMRYAECLGALGQVEEAVEAYQRVVEVAPQHHEARLYLSALLQQLGRQEEALLALHNDEEETDQQSIDVRLLFPKCLLLYSQQKFDDFIASSKELLFNYLYDLCHPKALIIILTNRSYKHRIQSLKQEFGSQFEQQVEKAGSLLSGTTVSTDDLWNLFRKLCDLLINMKRYQVLQDVAVMGLVNPYFMQDTVKSPEVDFVCLTACILNRSSKLAYNLIREICVKQIDNNNAWNVFCQVITTSQDIRQNRFCLRLMMKHPDHVALGILNGHNAMVAGTYKHALGEYLAVFRQEPQNAMISMCIGVTFVHLASQKFASRRHSLIVQACAFLNQYLELRGECQETYYNLGRAMHQLGLFHAAIYYYEKSLTFEPTVGGEEKELFDLRREIAYNLSLIYQASGTPELAGFLMQKYLVI